MLRGVGLAGWINATMDFCFAGGCCACRAAREDGAGASLCAECVTELDALAAAPACERCAAPLAYAAAPCPYCRGDGLPPFERIVALGLFDDPLKAMIHSIKYRGAWPLAEELTDRLLARREPAKALLHETQVIVPVPLHFTRQLSRGYNQAALIAKRLGSRCDIRVAEALGRVRATETQTHLHSRAKREENLKDAFALLTAHGVRDRHVLMVDDVMTTGATLRAAARELRKAKPASVSALVLGVADPRGRGFERV
jgi:ComF family protein